MCDGIMMNKYTRFARMLFAAFLALAWCGALSAEDALQSPVTPPVEKKAEVPAVIQPPPAAKDKPAEKAPESTSKDGKAAVGAGKTVRTPAAKKPAVPVKKPALKKPPAKKTPAKDVAAAAKPVEKKAEEPKPADKKPGEGRDVAPASKDKKPVDAKPAAKKPAVKRAPEKKPAAPLKKEAVKDAAPEMEIEPPKAYYLVMRADTDDAVFADWSAPRTAVELANWAKTQGLVLAGDAPPLSVGKARFAQRYGSTLKLDGLNRNAKYRLYLDFVTFDDPSRLNIPVALEIYLDGMLAKRLSFGELDPRRNPVVLDIPYQLAMDGTVEVLFRDHSRTGGFFGLWDAVLTDQHALPASFDEPASKRAEPGSMRVKDDVIEVKPALKKRPAKIPPVKKKEAPAEKAAPKDGAAEHKDDAGNAGEAPAGKKADEGLMPPDAGKPAEEARKDPVAPELGETPTVKDPSAPSGPTAPQQPK